VGPENQDFLDPEMATSEASAIWAQNIITPAPYKQQVYYSYLCTFNLYGAMSNVFDVCSFIPRASGRGLGPGKRELYGPCEMALSR
jgi:hypothetical protein